MFAVHDNDILADLAVCVFVCLFECCHVYHPLPSYSSSSSSTTLYFSYSSLHLQFHLFNLYIYAI